MKKLKLSLVLVLSCICTYNVMGAELFPKFGKQKNETNLLTPRPEGVNEITISGKYRGRYHNANGSVKIRCRGNNNWCFKISADDDMEVLEFPNGDYLRRLPPVNGGSSTGNELDPYYLDIIDTYTYQSVEPWEKWNSSTNYWEELGLEDFWIIEN